MTDQPSTATSTASGASSASSVSAAQSAPPRIPGYRYAGELGVGGYAVVYLYEDEQLGRKVAVKALRHSDATALRQFGEEMRIVSAFDNQPHIVPILAPGVTGDGRPYFIMPYCSNGSLYTRVQKHGPLAVEQVVDVGLSIGRALAAVHEKGFVHRDVKPSNILLDDTDRPRLSDFGIAARLRPGPHDAPEDFAISVAWSPAEMIAGQHGNVASDVYSLGATLWHLLTGRSPYAMPGGNTDEQLERRIRGGKLPKLDRADVPAALVSLLSEALSKDPKKRPASAGEVVDRLAALHVTPAAGSGAGARAEPGGATVFKPKPQPNPHTQPLTTLPGDVADDQPGGWFDEPASEDARTGLAKPAGEVKAQVAGQPRPGGVRRVVVWAGGLAAVAAAVGGATLLMHGSGSGNGGSAGVSTASTSGLGAAPVGQNAGVVGEAEPPGTPAVVAVRSGRNLHFTWTYSASQATDTYAWRTTDGSLQGTAKSPSLDLPDPAGHTLCLQVRVVRADGSDATAVWSPQGCGS